MLVKPRPEIVSEVRFNGGSLITSYTVNPCVGAIAQSATTVTGNPPATSATISGLSNGTS